MATVTQRIKSIRQPRGGLISPKLFRIEKLGDRDNDEVSLNSLINGEENVAPYIVGTAVDYLTRYMLGKCSKEIAFETTLRGSWILGETDIVKGLLEDITGLDDKSIDSACKVVVYDDLYRTGRLRISPEEVSADRTTIQNIRLMVKRSLLFWEKYGTVVKQGMTFDGGYTTLVTSGEGDYATKDTIWEFKVLKGEPTPNHTLQLYMYYLLGIHSIESEFYTKITHLGIFNPRLNKVYLLDIPQIPLETVSYIYKNIMGYTTEN